MWRTSSTIKLIRKPFFSQWLISSLLSNRLNKLVITAVFFIIIPLAIKYPNQEEVCLCTCSQMKSDTTFMTILNNYHQNNDYFRELQWYICIVQTYKESNTEMLRSSKCLWRNYNTCFKLTNLHKETTLYRMSLTQQVLQRRKIDREKI